MKVIAAGLNKTGTSSLMVAFRILNLKTYHYLEHYSELGGDWKKIMDDGGTVEDFRRMYQGVDAVADIPAAYFWEEILEAFPEAKIILTMRKDEDTWIESVKKQQETFNTPIITLMRCTSPTYRGFYSHCRRVGVGVFGCLEKSPAIQGTLNELLCRMTYRRHNKYIMETAPKDKLLIYDVRDGWEPLCKFLDMEVPPEPFPHKNIRGTITEEFLKTNPTLIRAQREMIVSISLLVLLLTFGGYRCFKNPVLVTNPLERCAKFFGLL